MKKISLVAMLFISNVLTQTANAASQSECAIWLCAPGGFPSGCSAAKSALKHRLRHGKSPLPAFSSCAVKDEFSDPKDFTYTYRRVLKISEYKICTKWSHYSKSDKCIEYKTIPEHYQGGYRCCTGSRDNKRCVPHCVGAYRELKVFEKGKQLGKTYYW